MPQDRHCLVTASGRPLRVRNTPDEYGRVVYQVEKIGAFTLSYDNYCSQRERPRIHLRYGRESGPIRFNDENLPDRPVVCTVELGGGAMFQAEDMTARSHHWLHVSRHGRYAAPAPKATARRTADIVHTLVVDWLARADHQELADYHAWHMAPHRIRHATDEIRRSTNQAAKVLAELADQHAYRDQQSAIRGQAAPALPARPDPRHPDGQAILRLRAALDALAAQHHGHPDLVPAHDVVKALAGWLEPLGLGIPEWT